MSGGFYRVIHQRLLRETKYLALDSCARHVLLTMHVVTNQHGIEIEDYPGAMTARLAHLTGLTAEATTLAMTALERDGFIDREGGVVWLIGQLDAQPSLKASNAKHRSFVRKSVDSVPCEGIRDRMRRRYPEYFAENVPAREGPAQSLTMATEGHTDGMPMPLPGHAVQKEKEEYQNKEKDTPNDRSPVGARGIANDSHAPLAERTSSTATAPDPDRPKPRGEHRPAWVQQAGALYLRHVGGTPPLSEIARGGKQLLDQQLAASPDDLLAAWERYLRQRHHESWCSWSHFAKHYRQYTTDAGASLRDQDANPVPGFTAETLKPYIAAMSGRKQVLPDPAPRLAECA